MKDEQWGRGEEEDACDVDENRNRRRGVDISAYAAGSERSGEESESLWELLRGCLGNFREGGRVILMREI